MKRLLLAALAFAAACNGPQLGAERNSERGPATAPNTAYELLTAPGAATPGINATMVTSANTGATSSVTLAAGGTVGQRKIIALVSKAANGDSITVTPSAGGVAILAQAGDRVEYTWTGSIWMAFALTGTASYDLTGYTAAQSYALADDYARNVTADLGDGSDGSLTVANGVTTTLTGPKNYTFVIVQSGGTLRPDNWPIRCTQGFDIQSGGIVTASGTAAAVEVAGVARPAGMLGAGGTDGKTGTVNAGATWGAKKTIGALGGAGGAGASGAGGAAPTTTYAAAADGPFRSIRPLMDGYGLGSGAALVFPFVGIGGSSGAGDGGVANGGGGGGGGGWIAISASVININGTLQSQGGIGGYASSGLNTGGGGGGGGGVIALFAHQFTGTNLPADGASAGAGFVGGGGGGGKQGSGVAGSAGAAGYVLRRTF